METRTYKVYKYNELTEDLKKKCLERYAYFEVEHRWWEFIFEDAENVGLNITGFDLDRGAYCEGNIVTSAPEVIENLIKDHGKTCETYQTAKRYQPLFEALEPLRDADDSTFEDKFEELEKEFLHDILEDYRIILQKEFDFRTSRECVEESLIANDYDFTEDGRIVGYHWIVSKDFLDQKVERWQE